MRNFFSSTHKTILPEPHIGAEKALDIGRELALLNNYYWDSATATVRLTSQFFNKRCWDVMPGYAPKEWVEQALDENPTRILIDAETGMFAGLAFTRHIESAEQLVGRNFKLMQR